MDLLTAALALLVSCTAALAQQAPGPAAQRRVTLDAPAGTFHIRDGRDFAAAFVDGGATQLIILNSITLSDEDWSPYALPVRVDRNITITGASSNPRDWPLVDLRAVSRKAVLGAGLFLVVSGVAIANPRSAGTGMAPGIDLLSPAGSIAFLRMQGSALVQPACFPPPLNQLNTESMPRPPNFLGQQQTDEITIGAWADQQQEGPRCSGSGAEYGTDPAVLPLRRCWEAFGLIRDLVTYSASVDLVLGRPAPDGYIVELYNVTYLCATVMTQECIQRYGPAGCWFTVTDGRNGGPGGSGSPAASPPNPVNSTSGAGGVGGLDGGGGSSTPPIAAGAGGATGSSGGKAAIVGGVVGGVGGALLLACIVLFAVWRQRKQQRQQAQQQQATNKANDASCSTSSYPTIHIDADGAPATSGKGLSHSDTAASPSHLDGSMSPSGPARGPTMLKYPQASSSLSPTELSVPPATAHGSSSGNGTAAGPGTGQQPQPQQPLTENSTAAPLHGDYGIVALGKLATPVEPYKLDDPQAGSQVLVTPLTPHRPDVRMEVEHGTELQLLPKALGRGSFGRVVQGTYQGQVVAVKLVTEAHAANTNALAKVFAQEVEVLARCCHPNVVRLLAACLTPPRLCLVMELMDTSLDKLIHNQGAGFLLPLDTVLDIACDIASGLAYLHPTIVHRDLKPGNVLINRDAANGQRPRAKLTDFGLSRLRSSVLVTERPEAGTPAYTAPECMDAFNTRITDKADMYSFGCVLYEMLSGRRPWPGYNLMAIAHSVTELQQRPPLDAVPDSRCPPALRQLVRQCWEADPRRRPAAAEAAKELALLKEQLQGPSSIGMTTGGGDAAHAAHAAHAAAALAAQPPDAGAPSPSVAPNAAGPAVLSGTLPEADTPFQGQADGTWPEGGSREGGAATTAVYGSTYGGSGTGGVPQLAARAHAQQRGAPMAAPALPAVLMLMQLRQQEQVLLGEGDAVGEVVCSGQQLGQQGRQQPQQQLWDSRVEGLSRDLTALTDEGAGDTQQGTRS